MLQMFQIALVSLDLAGSLRLYAEALGYRNAGAQCSWGSKIQALGPEARHLMWWLVGDQDFFQIELFHYSRPPSRALRRDWSPADHGWQRFGVAVPDIDSCLAVFADHGATPILPPTAASGARRCAIRDPYVGIIIDLIEASEVAGPQIRYLTSSVSDIASARNFYADALKLEILPLDTLHSSEDEARWGLAGARRSGFVARARNCLIEVLEYEAPRGKPRPGDHRLSDQGIQNISLGARDRDTVKALLDLVEAAGHVPPYIFDNGENICGYILDPGRELELASIPQEMDGVYGFEAAPLDFFGKRNMALPAKTS